MSSNKKRRIAIGFEVERKKAPSSYGQIKNKCAVQKDEMKGLEVVIEQLRRDLTDAQKTSELLQFMSFFNYYRFQICLIYFQDDPFITPSRS